MSEGSWSLLRRAPATDLGTRARAIADAFARRHPATLPPPGSDLVPRAGRHVRGSAESATQIYVAGTHYDRDARGRITARAGGLPNGWSIRLTVADVAVVDCRSSAPTSRADPIVLRAQRKMADPSIAAGLARTLRQLFPGRPTQTDTQSLFAPSSLIFVREASVVVALGEDGADDGELIRALFAAAAASLSGDEPEPIQEIRRGHLRLVK